MFYFTSPTHNLMMTRPESLLQHHDGIWSRGETRFNACRICGFTSSLHHKSPTRATGSAFCVPQADSTDKEAATAFRPFRSPDMHATRRLPARLINRPGGRRDARLMGSTFPEKLATLGGLTNYWRTNRKKGRGFASGTVLRFYGAGSTRDYPELCLSMALDKARFWIQLTVTCGYTGYTVTDTEQSLATGPRWLAHVPSLHPSRRPSVGAGNSSSPPSGQPEETGNQARSLPSRPVHRGSVLIASLPLTVRPARQRVARPEAIARYGADALHSPAALPDLSQPKETVTRLDHGPASLWRLVTRLAESASASPGRSLRAAMARYGADALHSPAALSDPSRRFRRPFSRGS
ncbi:hypothetical protein Bbelb_098630 [Branchiostoma belcheri]|nr:hypothetical protein Bbelb_098630 [Branchiostoma belcheri]